ncbi:zinc finger CCCH domain-containing protein 48-like [Vicia villosa]|uniref:zinc finger CCCH domain-containing protein 48-like n=1 Tax=Vicia villosa TaxID=3911 RepID=UPI00273B2493|nr:zinc finger CCCH domain-containing protein 48-like [Vicia villosa]
MDTKVARFNGTKRVIGTKTCIFWLNGRCNRDNCRFLHGEPSTHSWNHNERKGRFSSTPYHNPNKSLPKHNASSTLSNRRVGDDKFPPKCNKKTVFIRKTGDDKSPPRHETESLLNRKTEDEKSHPKDATIGDDSKKTQVAKVSPKQVCKYWMNGDCVRGEHCQNLHSWFYGDGFATLAKLQGHKKLVTGIGLPHGSNKLYSGSTDGTLRTWDCVTGQCTNLMNLGAEATSLISEGPWIFVGLHNIVKAWNTQTASHLTLDGPKGRVLSMVVGNDTLLAGAEDGVISAWRGSSKSESPFELVASLRGHTKSVVCLAVGCNKMLYSGSKDQSIKVWDLDTFECKMTLNAHTDEVTSLICWDNFLLSGSSDCTIKVWYKTVEDTLEVAYSHNVENGVVALSGMTDPENKPILFCSTSDNSVRLYELPSFAERGRLFAKQEVGLIHTAPGGLFFTGDRTGLLTVWKWLEKPKVAASS